MRLARLLCVGRNTPRTVNGVAIVLGRGRGVAGSATGSERAQDPLLLAGVPGAPQTSSARIILCPTMHD